MGVTVAQPTSGLTKCGIPTARVAAISTVDHILVVDDDPAIRDVVADILEMSNFRVTTAANGAEALAQIRTHQPAAVLLDLMMPVMDGWEFLRRCRAEAQSAHIPVAIMSAARDASAAAESLGAQAFLSKPFELDAVLDVVARLTADRASASR